MRKMINISALVFFTWLVLNSFNIPSALLTFLLIGELPGTQTTLSPTMMLAIVSTTSGMIVFELLARRIGVVHRTRQQLLSVLDRRERLPRRRFSRIV